MTSREDLEEFGLGYAECGGPQAQSPVLGRVRVVSVRLDRFVGRIIPVPVDVRLLREVRTDTDVGSAALQFYDRKHIILGKMMSSFIKCDALSGYGDYKLNMGPGMLLGDSRPRAVVAVGLTNFTKRSVQFHLFFELHQMGHS